MSKAVPRRTAVAVAAAIAATVIVGVVAPPTAASASSFAAPVSPTARVLRISSSAFAVSIRSANATRFVLYTSTTKSDLYYASLTGGPHTAALRSARGTSSTVTIRHLPYTTAPHYYRVVVSNGPRVRTGAVIDTVGLRPAIPQSVQIRSSKSGTVLSWRSGAATGFQITQASNKAMTTARTTFTIRGQQRGYTVYDLMKGRHYYFAVRAINNGTPSHYSTHADVTVRNSMQPVRVLTFNLLEATFDGTREGSGVVAPWSKRQKVAAGLIKQTHADLIAIQEAAAYTGAVRGPRMADSLVKALGRGYALAHTEIPPNEPHYFRTGNYIIYKKSTYRTIGAGNHWNIGDTRTAAYQEFASRKSGAKVLFVSPHLIVGAGARYDTLRENETKSLVKHANAFAGPKHIPVVYAGDFNTDTARSGHAFDGPGIAMAAARIASARDVAQQHSNEQFNSANQYLRTPPASGQSIDYIFATPGVGVFSWRLILNLRKGKFSGVIASDHNPLYGYLLLPY